MAGALELVAFAKLLKECAPATGDVFEVAVDRQTFAALLFQVFDDAITNATSDPDVVQIHGLRVRRAEREALPKLVVYPIESGR